VPASAVNTSAQSNNSLPTEPAGERLKAEVMRDRYTSLRLRSVWDHTNHKRNRAARVGPLGDEPTRDRRGQLATKYSGTVKPLQGS
jgi:hypothetical protein